MIPVTKPYLPPLNEYITYLEKIWSSQQLTNHGPIVLELEEKLRQYFDTPFCFFIANGTIALQIAIKALELKGDVITTPFSYVATTSSLVWENCNPIFVDIEPHSFCINPELIEAAITQKTSAILATHVYGNPCNIEAIEKIAQKHNLKVIYDDAHAFGVTYKNKALAAYGDISILSFHATKIFNTGEGGAIVTNTPELAHKVSYMRNFGHNGTEDFWGLGINGKNSEFHAALGLCNLKAVPSLINARKNISHLYDSFLLKDDTFSKQKIREWVEYNYAYYPIIFPNEALLLNTLNTLQADNIFPRRYFYPCLNTLSYVDKAHVPVAEDISKRVLCLPLYPDLDPDMVTHISNIILRETHSKIFSFSTLTETPT